MASDDPVERVPAAQAVGEDLASGGQPALGAARDLALAEALDRDQLDLARPALGAGGDRRHEGRLARRATAPLAAGARAAEVSIVHLHPPRQRRVCLAPRHHRHDLVLHGPGGRLLDPETAPQARPRKSRSSPLRSGGRPRTTASAAAWWRGRSCPPWRMSASCTGSIGRGTGPPAHNARDGRRRGRRSRPASAAGTMPSGTAPRRRRLRETPRRSTRAPAMQP